MSKSVPNRLELMSFPLDPVTLMGAVGVLEGWIVEGGSHTVITINPEIIVQAETDPVLAAVIRKASLVTADGVGIVWAAQTLLGVKLPARVTGVDITLKLLERAGRNLRVFYLGGKPGVAESAAQRMLAQYGTITVGVQHGYFKHDGVEDRRIAERIRDAQPHVLLTGLGAGLQESFNEHFRELMNVPVAMGVGGTLDVLSGAVERAPEWTSKLGVEWVWRVAGDRRRWGRAPRLAKFVQRVMQKKSIARRTRAGK